MSAGRPRISTKAFALVAVVVALILAGIVSYYASTSPDGLDKVAQDKGFSSQERDHAAGDSPFADYSTDRVEDQRLSGAFAGVVGVTVVLVLAGGLSLMLRRRDASDVDDESAGARTPERR